MHEAKTHLSRLVADAVNGAEVGRPVVKLVPFRRTGFARGARPTRRSSRCRSRTRVRCARLARYGVATLAA
jgi:antitoxin (DNA-binding transcriptional repressor) of toxin-antitoxin stability system